MAQCIVIDPVCGFVSLLVFVCVCVSGSVTTIARNCVHRSSPNWVPGFVGKGSDRLQLIKCTAAPGKGVCAGQKYSY